MASKSVVIFGLSGNPFHLGHLFIASYLIDRFDEVIVVPCFKHVFNKDLIDFNRRHTMCHIALDPIMSERGKISVSGVERDLGGKSISSRTVEYFKNFSPNSDFSFAVGKDAYADFDKWEGRDKLVSMAEPFIVDKDDLFPNIHSTYIRDLLKEGRDDIAMKYLPKKVFEYINENKLYR